MRVYLIDSGRTAFTVLAFLSFVDQMLILQISVTCTSKSRPKKIKLAIYHLKSSRGSHKQKMRLRDLRWHQKTCTERFTVDLFVPQCKYFTNLFSYIIFIYKEIYPSQLTVEKANTSDDLANYLDLTFIIESNNRLYTKLYDKRDDFDFHIVNFPFLSSNIPSSPSYGVYISQLIRYARCCSYYDDFGYRHKLLVDRLLSQGYEVKRLRNSFKKFYGRYPDLIGKYQRSVKDMVADSFPD